MPDEDSQTVPDQPPPEGESAARPDPSQIEAHQARLARQAAVAVREQYVRQCLSILAPDAQDTGRPYVELLQRLQTVLTQEIEEQERHA
jgi:hypothetical protein